MQRQPRRNTAPELALRRELHRRGLRYRLDVSVVDSRRRHDIVFPKAMVVVEVRGCFWHGCPQHGTAPKANAEWWREKLAANRRRDEDTERRLRDADWTLVVVWEHEDPAEAAQRVVGALTAPTGRRQRCRECAGPAVICLVDEVWLCRKCSDRLGCQALSP
jgi:DNA mismatch endonuclease (patch repair protein)